MKFGVCGNTTIADIAAQARYDFGEWSVAQLLKPRETEDAFLAGLDEVHKTELPYPVANGFLPADLKITGHAVDPKALHDYVDCTMKRAERAGVEVIVLGSGAARRIPDGFDAGAARAQITAFCSMAAPLAQCRGVTIVVEPLNHTECNILTRIGECAALVREVDHPAIRLLVDAYHLMRDGDSYEDIAANGDLLRHVHIATAPRRLAPGSEPCDFGRFFAALANAGYKGRISIEGAVRAPESELPGARKLMSQLIGMENTD